MIFAERVVKMKTALTIAALLMLAGCTRYGGEITCPDGTILKQYRWGAPLVNTKGERTVNHEWMDANGQWHETALRETGEEGTSGQAELLNQIVKIYEMGRAGTTPLP